MGKLLKVLVSDIKRLSTVIIMFDVESGFTLCLDQIFIRRAANVQHLSSLVVVIDSTEKHFEERIDTFEINSPLKLGIIQDFPVSSKLLISIYFDEIIFTCFDFVFEGNFLDCFESIHEGGETFFRVIIRAFKGNASIFRIGSLREYKMSDFDMNSLESIGKGSYGTLYFCSEVDSGEGRALKCLSPPDIRNFRDPSIREVLPFISIPHHPSIVGIFGYLLDSNQFILVLEFVPLSLRDILSGRVSVSAAQLHKLMYEIVHCLGYLHSFGLIHRDLSPSNIMVTKDIDCRIIDFGISRFSDDSDLTQYVGNRKYMSPEVRCGHEYGIESDYYSTSLILCDLLDADRSFISYDNIGEISDKSLLYILIPFYNTEKSVSKTDRLTFHEMSTLFEILFEHELVDINKCSETIQFSNNHLFSFSYYLIYHYCFSDNFLFLEFASELLKVGINDTSNTQKCIDSFQSLYIELLLMGCVAFDLEPMKIPSKYHFNKFDRGRVLYFINVSYSVDMENKSYKNCFLDFNEEIGFYPAEFSPGNYMLCLVYHSMGIARIKNYTGNPTINKFIEILDKNDIDDNIKYQMCSEVICESSNEVVLSFVSQLADIGYKNMEVEAWMMFNRMHYGWKEAVKYITKAINHGSEYSKNYYSTHPHLQNENKFKLFNVGKTVSKKILERNLPDAFFSLFNVCSDICRLEFEQFSFIGLYYLSFGLFFYRANDRESFFKCLEMARNEGSNVAKTWLDPQFHNGELQLTQDYLNMFQSELTIAHIISDFFLKAVNQISLKI